MENFKLFLENYPEQSDMNNQIWYHGRTNKSDTFSLDYVGKTEAEDAEGPGFYFTNSLQNAKRYAEHKGIILVCKISYKKLCPLEGKPNERVIRSLITKSPECREVLQNWDEHPIRAYKMAVEAYKQYDNPNDSYQTIANDFYKHNAKDYLINLGKFYDGHMARWIKHPLEHLIIYKPEIIKVVDRIYENEF